ncbi:aminotransferase class V-fold PLP-dependent enzyme [Thioalkalicoccus limnaeus]|uniref:Aminotransferase class V-fold PLP-dependent enzyme n=1 Tax=Thioalkalicoccus limnaeus TaxID=120681 RepID=A0ABV4BEZ3_9GAMM
MTRPIYLDYNATTPVAPEVLEAVLPYLREHFGNPSSSHAYGREAQHAVTRARGQVAALIGAAPREMVFTGCATEGNNLAILGVALALRGRGRHLITSAVEHPAVARPMAHLAAQGWVVTVLPVDEAGRVSHSDLAVALRDDTLLVSVMHANNEVGTLQPIAELAALARSPGTLQTGVRRFRLPRSRRFGERSARRDGGVPGTGPGRGAPQRGGAHHGRRRGPRRQCPDSGLDGPGRQNGAVSHEPQLPAPAIPVDDDAAGSRLWPSPDYSRQVKRLRAAVGETVYIAELDASDMQLGVRISDRPYVLLGVVDFPRPDPVRGLAPHCILLDDGRGVNLGRIARVSVGHAFGPTPAEILFQDRDTLQAVLFRERRLSPELIAQRSKALLGRVLGQAIPPTDARLKGPRRAAEPDDGEAESSRPS